MKNRIILFEKIFNARDLGGLQTAQGRTISSGLLIRSANLADATQADKKVLQEQYNIAKLIDLRTATERNERPDVTIPNVNYIPIPIFEERMAGISHEKSFNKEQILAAVPNMGHLYRKMVTDEPCRQNLGKAAQCVMEHDFSKGSVLWHCTEGKDRCGLLSAVLLSALGVERDTIIEDYMLTNQVNKVKADRVYQMILEAGKSEAQATFIRDILLAKEEYISEAFKAIDEQYKTMDVFLSDGLHIPNELIEKFQSSVLE